MPLWHCSISHFDSLPTLRLNFSPSNSTWNTGQLKSGLAITLGCQTTRMKKIIGSLQYFCSWRQNHCALMQLPDTKYLYQSSMRLLCNTTISVVESNRLQSAQLFSPIQSTNIYSLWAASCVTKEPQAWKPCFTDTGPKPVQGLWFLVIDKMSFSGLRPLHISFMLSWTTASLFW